MPKKDMKGMRFGRLTVLKEGGKEPQGQWKWLCRCDCGNETIVTGRNLRRNHTQSCGCYLLDVMFKHGQSGKNASPEYVSWHSMMQRCYNENSVGFADYGGRGIIVCEKWHSFIEFFNDMGKRPTNKHSLDRFPNNETGNYEPSNCRWATVPEQLRNRRNSFWIEYKGVKLVATDWAKMILIKPQTITNRIRNGMSIKEALNKPPLYRTTKFIPADAILH